MKYHPFYWGIFILSRAVLTAVDHNYCCGDDRDDCSASDEQGGGEADALCVVGARGVGRAVLGRWSVRLGRCVLGDLLVICDREDVVYAQDYAVRRGDVLVVCGVVRQHVQLVPVHVQAIPVVVGDLVVRSVEREITVKVVGGYRLSIGIA